MSDSKKLIIVGAGGHGKVVASTALENSWEIIGYLDDKKELVQTILNNIPIIGTTTYLNSTLISAIHGVGNNKIRKKIVNDHENFKNWETLIHPTAYVHPTVRIGKGTVIFAGAIIQPDAIIGDHCIVNTGVTIDHDSILKDYVHLAPGVHLAGGVQVGEGAFMGIGSVVIPNIIIGNWVQVGAGSVVTKNIQSNVTVMGVPAKEKC